MTRLDGLVTDTELTALKKLGDALKIPEPPRQQADAIAQGVAMMPEGDRPDRFDLLKVREILSARLAKAEAGRSAKG